MNWLAIALGGALGSVLRYAVYRLAQQGQAQGFLPLLPTAFPLGTFAVNVLGCFAIGLLWSAEAALGWSAETRAFAMTGLLGGFTTFSTFGLEGAQLLRGGEPGLALGYLGLSVALGLGAAFAGLQAGRWIGA
jgi:CrcB protein